MKRKISIALCILLVFSMIGCTPVKTKSDVSGNESDQSKNEDSQKSDIKIETIPIALLGRSTQAEDLNLIRDLLAKQGFEVKINMQPDYASFMAQVGAGNFDIAFSGWAPVSGNGDYATRALFRSGGDSNIGPIADAEIDTLIDKACTVTYEESIPIYAEIEKKLIDNAYIAPLYVSRKIESFNHDVLDSNTVGIYTARSVNFESLDLVDKSQRDTFTVAFSQAENYYTSADPLKSNENSTYVTNANQYVRLINFNDDIEMTTEGSLSYDYSIADGNKEFYFILRDDINFAKVSLDRHSVDSGEKVGAEDVVFSLERAKDKNSVPNHATYSLHENIDKIEIVTDISELESTKQSVTGKTIKESLQDNLPNQLNELCANKNDTNNKDGKYQVIKITTKTPFPQVVNFLGHNSAGILSKSQVEKINTFDVAAYDPNVNVSYGDQETVTEGEKFNNQIYASGPYILLYRNDYEMVFEKNPNYMVGTEYEPKIKNIKIKLIPDKDSALSSLRSGEIHMLNSTPPQKDDIIKEDTKLTLKSREGISTKYLVFNMSDKSVCNDLNIRKAIQNSMDQNAFISVFKGSVYPVTTTLTPIMDTGYTFKADPSVAKTYLQKYFENK